MMAPLLFGFLVCSCDCFSGFLSDEFLLDVLLHEGEHDGEDDDYHSQRCGDCGTVAHLLHLEELVVGVVRRNVVEVPGPPLVSR